jgi:type I restriction enzyme S subunit
MTAEAYSTYKESGVEWLGDVPIHWQVLPTKRFFGLVAEPAADDNNHELLSIYTDIGVRPRKDLEARGNRASTTDGYWMVKKGDLIVNKLLAWMGAIGMSEYDGVTSPAYDILRQTKPLDPMFFHYLFRCGICFTEFRKYSRGIMDMRLRLYFDQLGQLLMPFPRLDEQKAISSFLDVETSKIDGLVSEQRRLIELLKEKRQAVISHAVTKGLNPNAPMKPSGIQWLGDVPEQWNLARVKFASHRISKGDTPSNFGMEFALDGPVRFIKIENIGEGELIETPKYTIDFDAHKQLARSQLRSDDIVFAIAGATTGKCAIVRPEHLPANTNQAVAYIRPNSYVRPMFLVAWLQNPRLLEAMWEITSKSAQPNLSMENLGNLPIPIPPKVEQDKIVEYIHKIGGGYLTLIVEAERAIELLLERRIALISAAVTGKIDVRGYAPKEAVA